MPEGDTIHKIAAAMAPRLEGRRIVRARLTGAPDAELEGRSVERVEARGKHLFVHLSGDLLVRSHLGMHGSWHRYAPRERWRRPAHQASLVLQTDEDVFVCFRAKEAECLRSDGARARDVLHRIGPDLTGDAAPDFAGIVLRARGGLAPDASAVDVLLHQGVASGIGNVYKSEVLFLERVHPLRPLGRLSDADLERLYRTGRRLLRANLHGGARATRAKGDGGPELWVYGRGGKECLRCESRLESAVLGSGRRITTWCPRCQADRA